MNDDSQFSRTLQQMARDAQNAARAFEELTAKLRNKSLEQYTESLKDNLVQMKLIREEDKKYIKNASDLAAVLKDLESKYDEIKNISEKSMKKYSEAINDFRSNTKNLSLSAEERAAAEEKISKKKLGYTQAEINLVTTGLEQVRREIDARKQNISSMERLGQGFDSLRSNVEKQTAAFFTGRSALDHFKKGLLKSYDDLSRLTNRGLFGSYTAIQMMAPQLLMYAQEFEDVINRNRDIVNSLGGGARGIQAFGEEIKAVKENLTFLGKDAGLAAAKMIEITRDLGINKQDKEFKKVIGNLTDYFTEFNVVFGDSYEMFEKLVKEQISDITIQTKLNSLNKTGIAQLNEEILARDLMLKKLGLSNEQIVDFTKKLNEAFNPSKNTIKENSEQGIALSATFNETARQLQILQSQGDKEAGDRIKQLMSVKSTVDKFTSLEQSGQKAAAQQILQSPEGQEMVRQVTQNFDNVMIKQLNDYIKAPLQDMAKNLDLLLTQGRNLVTARRENKDQTTPGEHGERYNDTRNGAYAGNHAEANPNGPGFKKNAKGENDYTVASLAFQTTAETVTEVTRALNSSFGELTKGALAAAGALANIGGPGGLLGAAGAAGAALGGAAAGGGGAAGGAAAGGITSAAAKTIGVPIAAAVTGTIEAMHAKDAEDKFANNQISEKQKNKEVGEAMGKTAGALIGAAAGAEFGATVGTILFPGAGTIGGGLIGAIVGGVGAYLGSLGLGAAGGAIGSRVGSDKLKKDIPKTPATSPQAPTAIQQQSSSYPTVDTAQTSSLGTKMIAKGDAAPMLDLIAKAEGTDVKPNGQKARGYNEVLGYGQYGHGDDNLTEMTLDQVAKVQNDIRFHPNNKLNSGAVGRYQIVGDTLQSLIKEMGLDPKTTKFDQSTQDAMARQLLKRRGYDNYMSNPTNDNFNRLNYGMGQEWASMPSFLNGQSYYQDKRTGIRPMARVPVDDMRAALDASRTKNYGPQLAETPKPTKVGDNPTDTKLDTASNVVKPIQEGRISNREYVGKIKLASDQPKPQDPNNTFSQDPNLDRNGKELQNLAAIPGGVSDIFADVIKSNRMVPNTGIKSTSINAVTVPTPDAKKQSQDQTPTQLPADQPPLEVVAKQLEELKKHTDLLSAIVNNTMVRQVTRSTSFQTPNAFMMNGLE